VFARAFFGARYYGPRYFGDGGDLAPVVTEETFSGGWRRRHLPSGFRQREQTAEEIKAERVRMGILPPDPSDSDAVDTTGSIKADPGLLNTPSNFTQPYSLAAHLLPEDLAGLEALAARAAQLTVDEEIRAWLLLAEQQRLNAEWLRDEDDAAVLMLAIATLH
jgi:hypothetical protein